MALHRHGGRLQPRVSSGAAEQPPRAPRREPRRAAPLEAAVAQSPRVRPRPDHARAVLPRLARDCAYVGAPPRRVVGVDSPGHDGHQPPHDAPQDPPPPESHRRSRAPPRHAPLRCLLGLHHAAHLQREERHGGGGHGRGPRIHDADAPASAAPLRPLCGPFAAVFATRLWGYRPTRFARGVCDALRLPRAQAHPPRLLPPRARVVRRRSPLHIRRPRALLGRRPRPARAPLPHALHVRHFRRARVRARRALGAAQRHPRGRGGGARRRRRRQGLVGRGRSRRRRRRIRRRGGAERQPRIAASARGRGGGGRGECASTDARTRRPTSPCRIACGVID
mmetsp:Transcript_4355/g.15078  ORF Transcript_4355/g.15078 Transcript_4355/m.15078 type:complete len:337 (-) Transcript_4355:70-1080(-)